MACRVKPSFLVFVAWPQFPFLLSPPSSLPHPQVGILGAELFLSGGTIGILDGTAPLCMKLARVLRCLAAIAPMAKCQSLSPLTVTNENTSHF